MKRLTWFSAVLAAFLASSLGLAQVGAPIAGASGPPAGTYTQAQQIAAAQGLGVPYIIAKSSIPLVVVSTGSMANNGVLTVGTALPRAIARGYFNLPASAISAGSSAGWYYTECSTTTACVVFNNTYTAGVPAIPASKTAFVTTGPGAYTGVTSLQVGHSLTIPANVMGANGLFVVETRLSMTNNADVKTETITWGGNTIWSGNLASNLNAANRNTVWNLGVTNAQLAGPNTGNFTAFGNTTVAYVPLAADTTAATTLTVSLTNSTATDNFIIESVLVYALSDGT